MREKELLKKSYTTIFYYCGVIALVEGGLLLLPLLALPWFYNIPREMESVRWFVTPALASMAVGALIMFLFKKKEKVTVSMEHSAVIVVFAWAFGCLLGGVPFALSGQFTYLHGLFESVSGWTTTGLTVVDTETVPNLLLLWRSIMQYIGGAGFAVIMLSILSGPSASGIYQAEGHQDEILPNIKQQTKMVVGIYLFYLLVGVIAYVIAGMPVFDSINHCMTALATGGFSTKNASIGFYGSLPIEVVTIALMIIGHINFATHHYIFQKKWKVVYRNAEIRSSFVLILIFLPVTLLFVTIPLYASKTVDWTQILTTYKIPPNLVMAARKAAFESISALTGTGFSTVSYTAWTSLGVFIIIFLMCAGGHTNSTSGGIKQLRIYMIYKSIVWMIQEQFLPKRAVTPNFIYKGESRMHVKPQHLRDMFNYVIVYILTYVIGSGVLMAVGFPMKASLFEFASALGTVGLSFGITSYSSSAAVLITEIIGMFLGRLEFFVIFYCLIKIWRDAGVMVSKDKV